MIKRVGPTSAACNDNYWYEQQKKAMVKQLQEIKYCVFCGQQVLQCSSKDSNGMPSPNSSLEWEQQNSCHWECYLKEMRKRENGTQL